MKAPTITDWLRHGFIFALLGLVFIRPSLALAYDPLTVDDQTSPPIELTVHDASRQRDIPIRVYLPTNMLPQPVILFSHGLGGSRTGSAFLGQHWAARGYVVVYLQHPGSDDSVWNSVPLMERLTAMRRAASLQNLLLRVKDVSAVLDQLTAWNEDKTNRLAGRLDLQHIGMSGHSFGAVTTEAVSGESFPLVGPKFTDSRITAALAFSPSSPKPDSSTEAFRNIPLPWLLMTGTKDVSPLSNQDLESRLAVYDNLQGAPKYEVVLENAEHSAFTDRALPGDHEPRNPNHHRVILAVSTAFWDTYLRGNPSALAWLNSTQPRSVMESADRWQFNPGPQKTLSAAR